MQLSKTITLLGHLSYHTALPSTKQELNNSVLKKHPGTTAKGECESGPSADSNGWHRIAGRRILFRGRWRNFEAVDDEVRQEALSARERAHVSPAQREPWPYLCGSVDTATSLPHCPSRCTVRARALCVKSVLRLRPTFASGKTVKDLLHGCKQWCSLEN